MVELQPSKLIVRVRFPSPAPSGGAMNFPHRVIRPGSGCPDDHIVAHVAQSVEHLLGKEEVEGSIPFVSTTFSNPTRRSHGKG